MFKEIEAKDFILLADYIKEVSGIELDQSKRYLVESRLSPLVEKLGCTGYSDLYAKIKSDATGALRTSVIEAITTHETSFFRDRTPFELLRLSLIPRLLANDAKRPIRIWSAACSTGQEAYSMAMALTDSLGSPGKFDIRILGTDISEDSVRIAQAGEYQAFEVARGLTPEKVDRYMNKKNDAFQVKPELREMVQFKRGNVLQPLGLGPFDIILCRNIAIYFSEKDRKRLFEGMAGSLKKDGVLFIGATETLIGTTSRFGRREEMGATYYTVIG